MKKPSRVAKEKRWPHSPEVKAIYQKFIKPFRAHFVLPEETWTMMDYLAAFFCVDTRTVLFAKATQRFTMPGQLWGSAPKLQREVPKGSAIIVRIDSTKPDFNELTFKDQTFVLNKSQWDVVRNHLETLC